MIRRIRTGGALPSSMVEDLLATLRTETESVDDMPREDAEMDVLLKHAFTSRPEQGDGGRVWQQLTRKVRGPFGMPALEAPTCNSFELELMASGGRTQSAPFVVTENPEHPSPQALQGSELLWHWLRFVSTGLNPVGRLSLFT